MENVKTVNKITQGHNGAIHVIAKDFKVNLMNGQVKMQKLMNLFKKLNSQQLNMKLLNGFRLIDLIILNILIKVGLAKFSGLRGLMDLLYHGILKPKFGKDHNNKMFA